MMRIWTVFATDTALVTMAYRAATVALDTRWLHVLIHPFLGC